MDISIVELCIYVFMELFSLSMLILSTIKEIPNMRASSIIRAIYLIPGMIAAAFMAQTGQSVTFYTITTITKNLNTTDTWKEDVSTQIVLLNPVWGYFHILIFFVLLMFVINQMYNLLTKPE